MGLVKEFNDIKKRSVELGSLKGDLYYSEQDKLNKKLVRFLRDYNYASSEKFTLLSRPNFLKLCCMVSLHRPIQTHQFLNLVSMCVGEK